MELHRRAARSVRLTVRLSIGAACAFSLLALTAAAPDSRASAQAQAGEAASAAVLGLSQALGPLGPDASRAPALDEPSRAIPRGLSRLRTFSDADGLNNLVIVSITQDVRGALWLGTDDGVYHYDGERFTLYSLQQGLPSTTTQVVGLDPFGEVCSGSKRGLVCWNGARFTREGAAGLPEAAIHTMVTHGQRMWVGTAVGLYLREGRGPFHLAPGWPNAPAPVDALWADDHGVIAASAGTAWLGDGLEPDRWYGLSSIGMVGDRIDGVLRDREAGVWIRTAKHLWNLPAGHWRAEDLIAGLPASHDSFDAAINMILGPQGQVWIGTDAGIAYRQGGAWKVLGQREGFPGARTLFVDREGTTWLGANGLYRWRGRGLIERFDPGNGLPGRAAWSFGRDREGAMWMGTDQCLSRMLDGRWRCLAGTENRVVRSFVFPPQGGVFLGGMPSGLLYIDAAGAVVRLGRELQGDLDQRVLQLALGPEGDLWIGTRGGLYRLRGAVPGPLERVHVPGISPQASFASLLVDGPRLWAPSTEGLVLIDGAATRVFGTADGFRVDAMRYMTKLHDRQLCVAYAEAVGASCFTSDGHTVTMHRHLDETLGLSSGKVYFLGEDRWKRLWVGTGSGVDVLTAQGGRQLVEHFTERDGLAGNDSTANGFYADLDGTLWFGAVGGASRVHAGAYQGPPPPPRTILRGGRLGELRILPTDHGPIETPHDHSALTLDFGSDSLNDPDRIELQVRMLPGDDEWSTASLREARYAALIPGSYRCLVRARVDQGRWGEPVEMRFVVLSAWWQSRWFLALLGLLVIAVIAGLFSLRQRAILQRRTHELDAQASARLHSLLDTIPDLILVQRHTEIIYMNLAARTLFSTEAGPGATAKLRSCAHPQDLLQLQEMSQRAFEFNIHRAPETLETRVRDDDGNWHTLEMSCVRQDFGGAPALVYVSRDVTERHRLRAKLVVSDRMASLGTLAAGIAHEINNPLTYVIGNLELVAETLSGFPDEDLTSALADASDGAERVRKIVSGLRTFSRGEEEKRVPIDLRGSLQAAIRLTGNEVRHRARMVSELAEVPLIIADDGRLTQVFINLLVNAAHAIPEGKSDANRITARSFTDEQGRAVVEISDTGKGMTPEVLARVFDPFFTTKDVGVGTGLGLSICHGIVEGLGGQIAIDSTLDQGTTVRVVIPPISAAVLQPQPEPLPVIPAPRKRRHILVIDDEPLVAEMLCRTLRRDHEITVDSNGKDALDRIVGGARFDAIVTDVMMPNMTGIELLEELLLVAPDQARRLIFLSGGVFSPQMRVRLEAVGAPQLAKPVDTAELRSCITKVATMPPPIAQATAASANA